MKISKLYLVKIISLSCIVYVFGCSDATNEKNSTPLVSHIVEPVYESTMAQGIDFKRPGVPSFLAEIKGVSRQESWGRWSDANLYNTVLLKFAKPLPSKFDMEIQANGIGGNVGVPIEVVIGDINSKFVVKNWPDQSVYRLQFDNVRSDTILITPPSPFGPAEGNSNNDTRRLGLGLISLKILN